MERTIIQTIDAAAGQDHYIQTRRGTSEQLLLVAESFPDDALDPVALGGATDMFLRNHQAQARMFELIRASQDQHFFGRDFEGCRVEDLFEVSWRQ